MRLAIICVLLSISSFGFASPPNAWFPAIIWDEGRSEVVVGQGATVQQTVVFTSNRDVSDPEIWVGKWLKENVSIVKGVDTDLRAGERYEIQIQISADSNAETTKLRGAIFLSGAVGRKGSSRTKRKSRLLWAPLIVDINIVETFTNAEQGYSAQAPVGWIDVVSVGETFSDGEFLSSQVILPAPDAITGVTINVLSVSIFEYLGSLPPTLAITNQYQHLSKDVEWTVVELSRIEGPNLILSAFTSIDGRTIQIVVDENVLDTALLNDFLDAFVLGESQ